MSARHVAQYWFLHAINSNLPALNHMLLVACSPAGACTARCPASAARCARLAWKCIRDRFRHMTTMPLGIASPGLTQHIRRHLEIVLPSKAIKIPLRAVESFLYHGEVTDERCVGPARWILEIQSPTGEADLIAAFPS